MTIAHGEPALILFCRAGRIFQRLSEEFAIKNVSNHPVGPYKLLIWIQDVVTLAILRRRVPTCKIAQFRVAQMPHVPGSAGRANAPFNAAIKIPFRGHKLSTVDDDVTVRCGFHAGLAIPESQQDLAGFLCEVQSSKLALAAGEKIRADDEKTILIREPEMRLERNIAGYVDRLG